MCCFGDRLEVSAEMSSRSVNSKWSLDRLRGLIIGTAVTVGIIVFANVIVLAQLHQSVLREVQGNLLRQSLALSTVVERTFQSTDLVLASVAEKVRRAAAADGDLHQLTNLDYYVFLKEKMSGLPQIDALGILDADGKRLNLPREWPSPNTDLSYREYFQAIKEKSDDHVICQSACTGQRQWNLGSYSCPSRVGGRWKITRPGIRVGAHEILRRVISLYVPW